jgi:TonB family protein
MYRAITHADAGVTSAELVVSMTRGSSNVAISDIDRTDKKDPLKAVLWFSMPGKASVTGVLVGSVTAAGSSVTCQDSTAPVALSAFDGPVTVYDDATPHADLDETRARDVQVISDSSFTYKQAPDYPEMAREESVVGDIAVEIEVGPHGGHPSDAWIRWNLTSDGSDILAKAALTAALASTFTAPIIDGRPSTNRYLIIYTFRLGYGDLAPVVNETDLDMCPLVVSGLSVEGPSGGDPYSWYFLNASAKADNVSSAVIGIEDQTGKKTGYPWSGMTLRPAPSDPPEWTADAGFNLDKLDVKWMWVDHVTLTNGKTIQCVPVFERPQPTAGLTSPPRIISGKPLPLVAVQSVSHAALVKQVWPEYPAGADGHRAAGHVTVLCVVNDVGYPIDAFVTNSSGRNELDDAAIDAATASTFTPSAQGSIVIYDVTYRFAP